MLQLPDITKFSGRTHKIKEIIVRRRRNAFGVSKKERGLKRKERNPPFPSPKRESEEEREREKKEERTQRYCLSSSIKEEGWNPHWYKYISWLIEPLNFFFLLLNGKRHVRVLQDLTSTALLTRTKLPIMGPFTPEAWQNRWSFLLQVRP